MSEFLVLTISEILAMIDNNFTSAILTRERLPGTLQDDLLFRVSSFPMKVERRVVIYLLKQLWLAHVGMICLVLLSFVNF
jgi:hypothetical protein